MLTEMRTEAKINSLAKIKISTTENGDSDLICIGFSSDHFSSQQRSKKKSKLGKGLLRVFKVQ